MVCQQTFFPFGRPYGSTVSEALAGPGVSNLRGWLFGMLDVQLVRLSHCCPTEAQFSSWPLCSLWCRSCHGGSTPESGGGWPSEILMISFITKLFFGLKSVVKKIVNERDIYTLFFLNEGNNTVECYLISYFPMRVHCTVQYYFQIVTLKKSLYAIVSSLDFE